MIKEQKLKVQAAIQENQVRVTGKKIDDLQAVIQILRGANIPIPLQFINLQRLSEAVILEWTSKSVRCLNQAEEKNDGKD